MSSIGTGYDLSASQFSPDGRVFQVEYAQKAVENSGTAVALRGRDGVVFAVEKLVTTKLYEAGANKRIFTVDKHVGVAVAGLLADAKQLQEMPTGAVHRRSRKRKSKAKATPSASTGRAPACSPSGVDDLPEIVARLQVQQGGQQENEREKCRAESSRTTYPKDSKE
ncbi:hypothetical protein HPB50_028523 [Hyalomma asiaticum]|nr:hypothetical protein HPB50_028523 [Hyalomma asiaticum]